MSSKSFFIRRYDIKTYFQEMSCQSHHEWWKIRSTYPIRKPKSTQYLIFKKIVNYIKIKYKNMESSKHNMIKASKSYARQQHLHSNCRRKLATMTLQLHPFFLDGDKMFLPPNLLITSTFIDHISFYSFGSH